MIASRRVAACTVLLAGMLAPHAASHATSAAMPDIQVSTACDGRLAEAAAAVLVLSRAPASGKGVALQACGRIEAPPAAVWPVVSRCQHFKDFMPSMKHSELLRREPGISVCATHIAAPFPLSDLHSVTHNDESTRADGGFERRWRLLRGSYHRSDGSWTVLPWPNEPTATLLVYDVDVEMGSMVPDFIVRRVQQSTAPQIFEAVRQRIIFCAVPEHAKRCSE